MRKKFTMLFAALLAVVGVAKADVTDLPQITTDLENPIYYTIYNTRSSQPGGLMYYAGENVGLKDKNPDVTGAALENKYKFFFTGSHDEMYVHNAATGLKLASVGSWTEAGTAWAVGVSPKGGGLAFGPKGGLNGDKCWNEKNYTTNENTSDFTTWSANDAGSIFVVELAENCVLPIKNLFYVIECPLFEQVQGIKKGLYEDENGNSAWGSIDLTDKAYYWIPTETENGLALKNAKTGKFLNGTSTSDTEVDVNIKMLRNTNCQFNIIVNGVTCHANNHNSGNGSGSNIVSWGGEVGSASAWTFVQKQDPTALQEVVVKYNFTYGGEVKYTQEVNTLVGEEWPAITVSFPYGVSSATKPAGEVTAEGAEEGVVTKTIELAVNLPFTYASDYASVENWYYLIFHANQRNYLYSDGTENVLDATKTSVDAADKDAYSWAFVGNPFDGFKVVNKAAGAEKQLNAAASGAVLGAESQSFVLTKSTYGTNGFFMQATTGEYTQRFNKNQSTKKVEYWAGADAGSTFMVELRDDAAALQTLVDAAEATLAAWEQTGVGYVTASAEDKTAVSEAVTAAKAAIENKTGYDAAQVALEGAVAAAKTYTIQPEAGKFYTIVNAHTDNRGGQSIYVNEDGGMQYNTEEGVSKLFQFVPVPAADGKFYLYNIKNGTYLSTAKQGGEGLNEAKATSTDEAKAVTIENLGVDNQVKIVPEGGNMIHAQASGSAVVGWNTGANDASAWKITEVEFSHTDLNHTLTVTEAGWATLVLGYNTTIPAGAKAYAVSSIAEGKAVLAKVADVLPAHTPVLIEAEAGNYEFNYTATEATVASNLLAGSVFNTYVAPVKGTTNYVLSNNGGVVALYKKTVCDVDLSNEDDVKDEEGNVVENINDHITFGANKAYLPVETATEGAPAMFAFSRGGDDDSTGIDQLINANGEVVIYDLAGRRVEKMEKGIYIVNGKKVIR